MERFPRGTLPPKAFAAVATMAPNAVARPQRSEPVQDQHDLSTTCPACMAEMYPEHAHYKCPACGYRDSSSF